MKRIFICLVSLILSHTTTILCMVNANNSVPMISPPATPKTPRSPVPTTPRECACTILARKCKVHPSERPFDDGDHPLKSPKDQPRSGDIPSPKSASPSKLSLQTLAANTLAMQSSDAAIQSNDANNQN